jgi:hypothetical protein
MKKIFGWFGVIFAASVITSVVAAFFIVRYCPRPVLAGDLVMLENKQEEIAKRCGDASKEGFRKCSYPDFDFGDRITAAADEQHPPKKLLNLAFGNYKEKYFLGAHFYLSILLSPHVENAEFQFRVKGLSAYAKVKGIVVRLREGPILTRSVSVEIPVQLKDDWAVYSAPLYRFRGDPFSWVV